MKEEKKDPEMTPENKDLLFGGQVKPYETGGQGGDCCRCTRKKMIIVVVILVMLLLYGLGLAIGLAVGFSRKDEAVHEPQLETLEPVGVVVSDHEACADIGRDILARYGTAVDAAIATLICNGVRTPHSMGIGGGCFMLVYDRHSQETTYIDGRETGPKLMTERKYQNMSNYDGSMFVVYDKGERVTTAINGLGMSPGAMNASTYAQLSNREINARRIAVPGELKAYEEAHTRYGRLPWKELFEPTIQMIREGFPMSDASASALNYVVTKKNKKLTDFHALCEVFCANMTSGEPKKSGDTIWWPKMADTLQGIADKGADYIYNSPLTNIIVDEIRQEGGILDIADFIVNYKVNAGMAADVYLDNATVYTMDGANGGPVIALILNILKRYEWSGMDMGNIVNKVDFYHTLIEAMKFSEADKMRLGDPDYDNTTALIQKMFSEEYADILRTKITQKTHSSYYYSQITGKYDDIMGTSHVSVLSPYGDAVSVTSTVNWYYGSMIMSNSTGIIWNNEMDDFDTNPDRPKGANRIAPGKRPRSSMAPSIVVDHQGNVKAVIGGAGGSYIANSVAQTLAKLLFLDMPLEDVVDAKRIHHTLKDNTLILEKGFPEDIAKSLTDERGHQSKISKSRLFSVIESIAVGETGTLLGYADKRKPQGKASFMYRTVSE